MPYAQSREPQVQIQTQYSNPANGLTSTNTALIASRRGNVNTPNMVLAPLTFGLYTEVVVPQTATQSGLNAINWAKEQGATVVMGISATITLVAPDVVSTSGSLTTLAWNEEPYGFADLLGSNVSGSVTQTGSSSVGTIFSISQTGSAPFLIKLSAVTGTFATTGVLTIDYANAGVPIPDGNKTEQWVLDLYYGVMLANLTSQMNVTFVTPTIGLILVSDLDASFNADATPITITPGPNQVTVNTDGTVSLIWNTAPDNWLYMPFSNFGATTITQGVAVGTIVQQLSPAYTPNGAGVGVLLSNVTGTFVITTEVDLTLDDTVSVFSQVKNWYKYISASSKTELTTETDLTTEGLLFYEYVLSMNTPQASIVGNEGSLGLVGIISRAKNDFIGCIQPNSGYISGSFYPYFNRLGDVVLLHSCVAAASACMQASIGAPYPNPTSVGLLGLPVSSDASTYIDVGANSSASDILQYGLSPIAVNTTTLLPYFVNTITTQTTINGSVDNEFYDTHTFSVVTELKYRTFKVTTADRFTNAFITNTLIAQMTSAIGNMLSRAQLDGLIIDSLASRPTISVVQSKTSPHQLLVSYDVKIPSQLNSILVTINIVSATATLPTVQA